MAALGRFAVHHVGGRNGVRVFPICAPFEADMVSVFYDADVDCLPQIEARNAGLASELHVLPHCLWSSAQTRALTIARDAYASSLLPFNPTYGERNEFGRDHEYRYGETMAPARLVEVETITLDAALARPGAPQAPDFLSIDVQGAELEILKGGEKAVETAVALQLEVEFVDMYRGQPLVSDIFRHLDAKGFEFLRFVNLSRAYARSAPIGLRAETCDMSADALFVRRLDHPAMTPARLAKLAFVATVFGHFDVVGACLDRLPAGWLDGAAADGPGKRIARFLDKLGAARQGAAGFRPWTFLEKWPVEDGRPRFMTGPDFDRAAERLGERRKGEEARIRSAIAELRKLGAEEPYGFEPVLLAHEFKEQAENLKTRRIAEVASLLSALSEGRVF